MKHIVCFSGGEGSALVAVEVFRCYGNADLILLNHDINVSVEDPDIKRFKQEVAAYCGVPVTYANMFGWEQKDQFDVVVEAGAFKVGNGTALCTNRLKTAPFMDWMETNFPEKDCVCYYGFGPGEWARVQRRTMIMLAQGYDTSYPLLQWHRTIQSTSEIGVRAPLTYSLFKHANCVGCLKAGMQHWYVVYCTRPDIWQRGLWAEDEIGYTIIKGHSLLSLESRFQKMRAAGIVPTEKIPAGTFWAAVKRAVPDLDDEPAHVPCECAA